MLYKVNTGTILIHILSIFNQYHWLNLIDLNAGQKSKEEESELSKFMNDDMSTMLIVVPSSTMQIEDWNNNNNSNTSEETNVQFYSGVIGDESFGLDIKPVASLFPLENATNSNDNKNEKNDCYTWDNLSELC